VELISPIPSPDGRRLAVLFFPDAVRILSWPLQPDAPLPDPLPTPAEGFFFQATSWSADGRFLAGRLSPTSGVTGSGIVVWDTLRATYARVTASGHAPFFLQDGRRIVFSDEGAVLLVDLAGGRIRTLLPHLEDAPLFNFALSPDGRTLVLARSRNQVDLWLAEGRD
jgi:WD40 repeat protein